MLLFYNKQEEGCFSPASDIGKESFLYAEKADKKDIEAICKFTGLHEADIIDSLDRHEIPRVEKVQDNFLLFLRHPVEQEGHLHTISLLIIFSEKLFVAISPSKSFIVREILERKDLGIGFSYSDLLIQILQRISQEFSNQIRKVRHSVMAQRKEIHGVDSEDIFSLTESEEILNQYLSSLDPLGEALKELLNLQPQVFDKKTYHDLDDVLNSVKQSDNLCDTLLKNIRSLRDSYQIVFANKLTKTIQLLTALTIVFSMPNMIASIYGMNVRLPIAESSGAFYILLIIMTAISVLCGYWFYRKKWM